MTFAIGVDIGGTKVAAGIVYDAGNVLARARRRTPSRDQEHLVDVVLEIVRQLRAEHDTTAIGIGAAGYIDAARSTVLFAPNLAWRNTPLRDEISQRLDTEVVIENDANAAAWGEFRFGAGEQHPDLVVITVGTGIGGGLIIGSELYRGHFGIGGEPGHMRVVTPVRIPARGGNAGRTVRVVTDVKVPRGAVPAARSVVTRAAAPVRRHR